MKKKILVTGGAGYIGSHICLALYESGYIPVVFDNLSNGHKYAVKWGDFFEGDIRNIDLFRDVCRKVEPVGIVHLAGLIEVGESVEKPLDYYDVNVGGSLNVIRVAQEEGIRNIVFSSTCATFGNPEYIPMDEKHPQNPINPYGHSKLMVETMLSDIARAGGISYAGLRFFNACGAANEAGIGENHDPETHAIPLILERISEGKEFSIFGGDYDTPDGTCIRDYIHVMDLAAAHVKALGYLLSGGSSEFFNLGTGEGTSVKELLSAISAELGVDINSSVKGRRAGDAGELIADITKAHKVLDWLPERTITDVIHSAAKWHDIT